MMRSLEVLAGVSIVYVALHALMFAFHGFKVVAR